MTPKALTRSFPLALVLFAAGALWPLLAAAAPPVLEPGRERDVLALLAPFEDEGQVVDDVVLAGVRIRSDRVDLLIRRSAAGGSHALVTLRPLDPSAGRAVGSSFRIVLPMDADAVLRQAAEALAKAVQTNDDGRFFPVPETVPEGAVEVASEPPRDPSARHPRVPKAEIEPDYDLWQQPRTRLAMVAWFLLLAALASTIWRALQRAPLGRRRVVATVRILLLALTLLIALAARRSAPWTPLHANHHAFDDLAVVLDLPDSGPSTQRTVSAYGPSWLIAQRAATVVFGRHHDGVGDAACWWGALAVVLALAAAWGAGGVGWAAALAAMAMALAPVAMRVGHSESSLVVAQWLVAATLLLATRRGRMAAVGVLAGLLLLATGHVVGPALSGGTALLAWALPRIPRTVDSQRRVGHRIAWLVAVISVPIAGAALNLLTSSGEVADRVAATGSWMPIPGNATTFSLWFDPQQAPLALLGLAALGLMGLALRDNARRAWQGRLRLGALIFGTLSLGAGGLLVCASVSDGLRYQSTLAPALVVLAAAAPLCSRHARGLPRFLGTVAALLAGVLTMAPLLSPMAGATTLDAQGQWYHQVRRSLHGQRGDVHLLIAERGGPRGAVFQAPQGRLSASGPTAHEVRLNSLRYECEAGLKPRQPLYVLLPPACASGPDDSAALACSELENYISEEGSVQTGFATPLAAMTDEGIPGEFLLYRRPYAPWRIAFGRCP